MQEQPHSEGPALGRRHHRVNLRCRGLRAHVAHQRGHIAGLESQLTRRHVAQHAARPQVSQRKTRLDARGDKHVAGRRQAVDEIGDDGGGWSVVDDVVVVDDQEQRPGDCLGHGIDERVRDGTPARPAVRRADKIPPHRRADVRRDAADGVTQTQQEQQGIGVALVERVPGQRVGRGERDLGENRRLAVPRGRAQQREAARAGVLCQRPRPGTPQDVV